MADKFQAILAIDPGASGGLAFYVRAKGGGGPNNEVDTEFVQAVAMPDTPGDLVGWVKDAVSYARDWGLEVVMYLEDVGGYAGGRGAPGSAMFNFGVWASGPMWIAQCLGVRLVKIKPQKWQKALSLGTTKSTSAGKTQWKNKLKAEAQRRRPELKPTLKTADAILIMEVALQLEA